eukprot:1755339-Rhodomonas_salina.4
MCVTTTCGLWTQLLQTLDGSISQRRSLETLQRSDMTLASTVLAPSFGFSEAKSLSIRYTEVTSTAADQDVPATVTEIPMALYKVTCMLRLRASTTTYGDLWYSDLETNNIPGGWTEVTVSNPWEGGSGLVLRWAR